ncbi:MAG: protein kinase [Planctomycetes bacterium]|nr:protein kinase [Planctomycetota bacterium]
MGSAIQPSPASSESARRKKLGEIAVERGLVSKNQLSDALNTQTEMTKLGLTERIGTILLKKKVISKDTLQELLREQSGGVRRLGNFEILEKVGQGAMGVVYKARQVSMDRVVALKILARKYANDPQFIERFVKEARAAGQFSHENIVTAVDVGYVEPYHYFAMEYVEGKTLRKMLAERGALPEDEAVKYTLHIAKALEHALAKKIIHRDVKPENIIVTPQGLAKLLDMGLACAVGAEADEEDEEGAEESKHGASSSVTQKKAAGTPHYISPEAARGADDLDTRSDIYSLGCSFYQLLTNATPFEGTDARTIMALHITNDVPDPRVKQPEVSANAARILMKMSARDRTQRYETPTELVEDLQALLAGKPLKHAGGGLPTKSGKLRSATTTGPRAPIGARGTTGPRTPVQPRSTTGPASPVIVGDRTGSLSPTVPLSPGAKAAQAEKSNATIWILTGAGAAILIIGIALAASGGGPDPAKTAHKSDPAPAHSPEKSVAAVEQPDTVKKVDVKAPGPSVREERAKSALDAVLAQIKDKPTEFGDHQRNLQQAVQLSRGTPSADPAADAWTALEKNWKDALEAALKEPQAKAQEALAKGDFTAAADALKDETVAPNLRAFDWKKVLDEARKPVKDGAEAAAAKFLTDARAKAGAKTEQGFLDAIELAKKAQDVPAALAPSAKEAPKEIRKWEGEIAALKKAEEQAAAAKEVKGQQQADAAWKELAPLLEQNKFAQAMELLDQKIADRANADAKDGLMAEKADVETVLNLRKRAVEYINTRAGEKIGLAKGKDTIEGQVVANTRGGVTLKLEDGPEIAFSAEQLDIRDIDRFAPKDKGGAAEDLRQRALLYLADGDLAGAKDRLQKAKDAGSAPAAANLDRLERLAQGEAEASAQRAFKKAEDLFAAKQWKEAQLAYEDFQARHGKTKVAAQNAAQIKERLAAIEDILNPYRPGLVAYIFDLKGFKPQSEGGDKALLTRVDNKVDFRWGKKGPAPNLPNDFAVRWEGGVKTEKPGLYTFFITTTDKCRRMRSCTRSGSTPRAATRRSSAFQPCYSRFKIGSSVVSCAWVKGSNGHRPTCRSSIAIAAGTAFPSGT